MTVSRITKVAGASLVGFVAITLAADKANVTPVVSQVAGFLGAFVGSLAASRRSGNTSADESKPDSDDAAG